MAASGEARFALVFDRSAHLVASRQAINVSAVFSQPRQKVRKIFQLFGDDMDNAAFLLHTAGNCHIARA